MKPRDSMLCAALIVAVLPAWAHSQESAPAQPPAEAQVAQEFKKAAPDLFREWLARRPEVLKRTGLGERKRQRGECRGTASFFSFMDCVDEQVPAEYRIDVTKTDSVLTPFVGHLYVPVKETCTVRNVVPKGMTWSEKSLAALDPYCLDKTYDECIAAGAKPAPKLMGSACTGGPGFSFPFEDEVHLTFRWSEGKWEFEAEKGDKPVPPAGGNH